MFKMTLLTTIVAGFAIVGTVQAQHGHPGSGRIDYNFPSQYWHVQPPTVINHFDFAASTRSLGFFGSICRDGLTVSHVIPGSPACRSGLTVGTTIIRADRHRIRCEHDWECAINDARHEIVLTVKMPCGRMNRLCVEIPPCAQSAHQEVLPPRIELRNEPQFNPPRFQPSFGPEPGSNSGWYSPRHVQPGFGPGPVNNSGVQFRVGNSNLRIGFSF